MQGYAESKILKMKKLNPRDVAARMAMYEEAINSLDCYESADDEERAHEEVQKLVVIRQIKALQNKFVASHHSNLYPA